MSEKAHPPTIEEFLALFQQQPGAAGVTADQHAFIAAMRDARPRGVGYGWMIQMIEIEWEHLAPGSTPSAIHAQMLRDARARADALAEALAGAGCPLEPEASVEFCAGEDPDCSLCRALAAYREGRDG